ncbi:CAP domain-containing protein [Variovorax soli]|nr:CAP domain-containing protein [Variovorax soli]
MVAGCGGGGGGGNGNGSPPPDSPSTVQDAADSTLVTSVPAPTYAAGSEELKAFSLLNAERARCGFGLLRQSTALDQAARGHAFYQLYNNISGHFQSATDPHFTGTNPGTRAEAAGYNYSEVQENIIDFRSTTNLANYGPKSVRGLLSAPYHALSMLRGMLDVGISVMNSDATGTTATHGPRIIGQFDAGVMQGSATQKPGSAVVLTYPCEGSTDVKYELRGESPNPVPGRDLNTNPVGQGVMVMVREGQILNVTSAAMVRTSDGTPVALRPVMTQANDPNGRIGSNEAVVLPDAPLLAGTQYTVTLSVTNQTATGPRQGPLTSTGTNPMITSNSTGAVSLKPFTFTTAGAS